VTQDQIIHMVDISAIPLELLIYTFSFSTLKERFQCAQVSKYWNSIFKDPALWEEMNFPLSFSQVGENPIGTLLMNLSRYCDGRLKKLDISYCTVPDAVLINVISKNPKISQFIAFKSNIIDYNTMPTRTTYGNVEVPLIQCFKHLLVFDVGFSYYFGNNEIIEVLLQNPDLMVLKIQHFDITNKLLLGIAKNTRHLVKLDISNPLGMGNFNQCDAGMEAIFKNNENLREFCCSSANLTPQTILTMVIYGKNLHCLDISNKFKSKEVSEAIVKAFVKAKPHPDFLLKSH